jgi:hypothetical protein
MRLSRSLLGLAVMITALICTTPVFASTPYTSTETIPVPPASTYAGSGGGDGWGLALSSTSVYNVFHHSSVLTVACHLQATAQPCWSPETITDGSGNNFATSGQPGLWLDESTGHLYVYATRLTDETGGVVCIATNEAATNTDPFCGFTALTGAGEAANVGISAISGPAVVGQRWYAFNYFSGAGVTGDKNKLLCFNLTTFTACASQPFSVTPSTGNDLDGSYPPPAVAAIGNQVIVPLNLREGPPEAETEVHELGCLNGATQAACSGTWPIVREENYDSSAGAAYPLLTSAGALTGFCLPFGSLPCYTSAGASTTTPTGMASAITQTSGWNGPAATLGPRVYVPNGNTDQVDCYDASTNESCSSFPRSFSNLGLLYTVNPDPARPTCLWVNSDDGEGQIQNFDAYTGGTCGEGVIRVLASHLITGGAACTPGSYVSLQVTSPSVNTYTSGTISFEDGDGNPIPGASDVSLNGTGTASLAGLNLNTATGLPQFVISLVGEKNAVGSVVVKLTWNGNGTYNPSCLNGGNYVALGDSYSSGEGTEVYEAGTDVKNFDQCHRSTFSYPFQAELALSFFSQRFSFHACSGAIIQDLEHTFAADHSGANPGEIYPQLHWLNTHTSLVTLTIGGNNAHFAEAIKNCYLNSIGLLSIPCQILDNSLVTNAISNMGVNTPGNHESLTQAYMKIAKLAPNATVLVLGYPRFFPAKPPLLCGTGDLGSQFTQGQMDWINQEERTMDVTIEKAVSATLNPHIRYLEDYEAFRGHERCEAEPYLNGIKVTHERVGSFHPNSKGQAALAKIVEKAAG